jgi:Ca-activated chloride channel family protein
MKHCRLGLILILATAGLLAAQEPFTLKVDVPLVSVDAIVQDPSGHAVIDLTQEDFSVFEDGVPQEIRYFATGETQRRILLLFDRSGSTDNQIPFMARAIDVFLRTLRPTDHVSIASFADVLQTIMKWRPVQTGRQEDIRIGPARLQSNVYQAIEDGVKSFATEKGRKGLIVLTDGRDTGMFNETQGNGTAGPVSLAKDGSFRKVLDKLQKAGVPIYFIAVNTDKNQDLAGDHEYTTLLRTRGIKVAQDYLVAVRARMEKIAEATGGEVVFPKTLDDIAPLYGRIGQDLGMSYALGYAPTNTKQDGTHRQIEVRVRGAGRTVTQTRTGYDAR